MIIFDYFFYTIYRGLIKNLKRNKDDAKHSALCILVVYIPFSIGIIAYVIGLLYDNKISKLFIDLDFITAVIIGAITYLCFGIRY